MTRLLMALSLVALPASPAMAQPAARQPSEAYRQCMTHGDAARGNVTAIQVCVGTEQAMQDVQLAKAYADALAPLGIWFQTELVNSQLAWRSASKARCTERAAIDRKGNASASAYAQCMLDETIARADWLERYTPELPQ